MILMMKKNKKKKKKDAEEDKKRSGGKKELKDDVGRGKGRAKVRRINENHFYQCRERYKKNTSRL